MDIWVRTAFLGMILLIYETQGQSEVEVQLIFKKYVEKSSSVAMHCEHNVDPRILYKVTWLKNDVGKFFEFIKGRNPPFRNFNISGAEIDTFNSNEGQVTLRNLDFDASGFYYCEVSTDTPIFTKPSLEKQLHVILPQTSPPRITFIRRNFLIGEKLVANCTTSRARPAPHITWMINGKKVDEKYVRILHPLSGSSKLIHRSKLHQQQQQQQQEIPFGQNSQSVKWLENGKTHRIHPYMEAGNHFESYSIGYGYPPKNGFQTHFPFSHLTVSHEGTNTENGNKIFDNRKHRNPFSNKYRRFVSETRGESNNGAGNENSITSKTSSSGLASRSHRATISSSQLAIEVSQLHIGSNGKLELTCLATIPSHVELGEQFADYKTYSVKVEVEGQYETSSWSPPMSGDMAALGNVSSQASWTKTWKQGYLRFKFTSFLIFLRLIIN